MIYGIDLKNPINLILNCSFQFQTEALNVNTFTYTPVLVKATSEFYTSV